MAYQEATSAEALVALAAEDAHLTDADSTIAASAAIVLTRGTLATVALRGVGSMILGVTAGEAAGITAAGVAGTTGIVHPGMAAMHILSMCLSIMVVMGVMAMMQEHAMKIVSRREYTHQSSAARCVITLNFRKDTGLA